ncbi:Phage terminase, small subunit, partial [Mycobacterium terramassiliense]
LGRPRRPNHLKLLAGEREDRINRGEPLPSETDVVPPVQLTPGAQDVWDRLAADLINQGCLSHWDVDLFTAFCESAATYHECRERMGSDYVTQGSVKNAVPSPYWKVMRDCVETMTRIGGRFGLTPADRAGIDLSDTTPTPTHGPERLLSS